MAWRGDAVRCPADAELRAAIRNKPVSDLTRRKERIADGLWNLECASRSKYSVHTPRPADLSVEHVLPQAWMTRWPLGDGRTAPADKLTGADEAMLAAIHLREAALQTLGNLSMVTVPGNGTASNRAFGEALAQGQPARAQPVDPRARDLGRGGARATGGRPLADLAVVVWPGPGLP